ncbi:hypothetical protein GJ496_001724 [Pomphorhynchus laevis]|nr:hypothetical protein GJ496_001724 [Pomphorhynchus laevis]
MNLYFIFGTHEKNSVLAVSCPRRALVCCYFPPKSTVSLIIANQWDVLRNLLWNSSPISVTGYFNSDLSFSRAQDVQNNKFFENVNWQQVYQQKLTPPLIPPRGEVNAADALDIGNFSESDTKGIKLTEFDQKQYKDFNTIIVERWQQEILETVFDTVNAEADKLEHKKRSKFKADSIDNEYSDLILQGAVRRIGGSFGFTSQLRFAMLYPNRLELHLEKDDKAPEVSFSR